MKRQHRASTQPSIARTIKVHLVGKRINWLPFDQKGYCSRWVRRGARHQYLPVEHTPALARHAQRIKRFQQLTLTVGIVVRFGWRNTDVLRQARDGSVTVAAGSVAAHLTICTACASVA
jgi:hypothetical protein